MQEGRPVQCHSRLSSAVVSEGGGEGGSGVEEAGKARGWGRGLGRLLGNACACGCVKELGCRTNDCFILFLWILPRTNGRNNKVMN